MVTIFIYGGNTMMTESNKNNLDFVRYCINEQQCIPIVTDWNALFLFMKEQALLGVGFRGIERMKEAGAEIPRNVLLKWYAISEQIHQRNVEMNQECARLTQLFESEGYRTAILKGQANARLYPNPLSRQSGDIDIYVDGGYERVVSLLVRLGLIDCPHLDKYAKDGEAERSYHHIHLPSNELGIDVEIHFRPSSGVWNPFANKRLQRFLETEISQENELVEEGFRVPSLRFALIMQLAHIQKHFFDKGVGLRQIMDYYYLLRKAKDDNEPQTMDKGELVPMLKRLGLWKMAGAMMWLQHHLFGLEPQYMIALMDEARGKMLLNDILRGGNFGHHSAQANQKAAGRLILGRIRHIKLLRFDIMESLGFECSYWKMQAEKTIERIKRRSWTV